MGTAPCLALSGKLDSSLKKKKKAKQHKSLKKKKEVSKKRGGNIFLQLKYFFPLEGAALIDLRLEL